MSNKFKNTFSTDAIHYGYDYNENNGAVNPPIYRSSTFAFRSAAEGARFFAGEEEGYFYSRISNPTLNLLEQRVATLEGGKAAVAFSSGMGAIAACCWALLKSGDEVIADRTLYGSIDSFFHHGLEKFNVKITRIDLTDPENLIQAISPQTKLVYCETPANPNMRLIDIAAINKTIRRSRSDALFVVDNTFCTPYLQKPLLLGADIVVHSATKYLGGHGDVLAGIVVTNKELAGQIRLSGLKEMTGAVLSPMDAESILRGLETLAIRMDRHCFNAQVIAELLDKHPAIAHVYYPGLPDFPQYDLGKMQMILPGGMMACELHGGLQACTTFLDTLQLIYRAVSLGGSKTLAAHPASMTHAS